MPFTFSHPSILLPFLYIPRKWFSVTGLVVGSIAPDFEYFLRMRMKSEYSHTVAGVFWFDLPVCILIAFVFHLIVRNPLIDHLPRFLRERFTVYKPMDWNLYFRKSGLVVMYSFLIGIASHLLWDSFTHPSGYFAGQIPFLQSVIHLGAFSITGAGLFQKVSGIAGGLVLVWMVLRLPRHTGGKFQSGVIYWPVVSLLVILILFLRWLTFPAVLMLGHLVVAVISAFLLSLMMVGLIFRERKEN